VVNSKAILFVDHAPAVGGAERVLLFLMKYLDPQRWQPFLVGTPGAVFEQAVAQGIPTYAVPLPRLRRSPRMVQDWFAGVKGIAHVAQRVQAVLLVANTIRAAAYTALASLMLKRPFVWYMHDFWLTESHPSQLWSDSLGKQLLCASAKHVITISHATKSHLPCRHKIAVVHNGIKVSCFEPTLDGRSFLRKYGISLESPVVGTVGRLRPWKGQDRFLRILIRVVEAMPEARSIVVGGSPFGVDDGYASSLHHQVEKLGLREHVVFTGQLDDVRPALSVMDVFVHPGDPEPFGLVNIEAMAMAKPVVAFAHGALPEIVVDGQTGILVPPGDEVAMAESIVGLLGDPQKRALMGRAARERVIERFTIERVVKQVSTILEEVISR
jgi:glycosyltransferase involved in cell wall biosynthesis